MGNGHAIRSAHLPEDIDTEEAFEFEKLGWDKVSILAYGATPGSQVPDSTAIPTNSLRHAGTFSSEYFTETGETLKILEVFAGNRTASVEFAGAFGSNVSVDAWVVTDAVDYAGAVPVESFCEMDAVAAVKTYGSTSNVLLMIAPPKNFADYYCLRNFVAQKTQFARRWFVFVGDLGGEHGSVGMWDYCHNNVNLRRVMCKSIALASEKRVYIFEIIQSQNTQGVP